MSPASNASFAPLPLVRWVLQVMSLIADATGGAMRAVPYAPLCSRLLHGARASPGPRPRRNGQTGQTGVATAALADPTGVAPAVAVLGPAGRADPVAQAAAARGPTSAPICATRARCLRLCRHRLQCWMHLLRPSAHPLRVASLAPRPSKPLPRACAQRPFAPLARAVRVGCLRLYLLRRRAAPTTPARPSSINA